MFDGVFEGLAWLLAFFYDLTSSYGVSIILLTLVVMAVVTPLTLKGTKSMMAMQRLQPEMRRIQQECAGDRQRLNEEMLKFYRENDINPMGSCLPMLIQMPIFLVLFRVVQGLTRVTADGTFDPKYVSQTSALYNSLKGQTEMLFLGFDLEKSPKDALLDRGFIVALPYIVLIALWVGTSYLQQMQVAGRNPDAMTPQQRMMMRVIPIFSLTAIFFPAALSIYWVTSNLCRVATQGYISHRFYNVGGLGLGRKREGEDAVVDVKAKPAKPGMTKSSSGKAGGTKAGSGKSDAGKAGDGKGDGAKNAKPSRPASGRVTPAKRGNPSTARRPGAPGRRSAAPTSPSGERARRRVPNGPPGGAAPVDSEQDPRKKRRK
ncbi:MAG: membrane protein insertase YidC [Acidimicrobiales bacterium]